MKKKLRACFGLLFVSTGNEATDHRHALGHRERRLEASLADVATVPAKQATTLNLCLTGSEEGVSPYVWQGNSCTAAIFSTTLDSIKTLAMIQFSISHKTKKKNLQLHFIFERQALLIPLNLMLKKCQRI